MVEFVDFGEADAGRHPPLGVGGDDLGVLCCCSSTRASFSPTTRRPVRLSSLLEPPRRAASTGTRATVKLPAPAHTCSGDHVNFTIDWQMRFAKIPLDSRPALAILSL